MFRREKGPKSPPGQVWTACPPGLEKSARHHNLEKARKSYWSQLAEEFYPDEIFQAPVDLYFRMTTDMVEWGTVVNIDSQWHLDGEQLATARKNAVGALVTSIATREYAEDATNNVYDNLDRLAEYHRSIRQEIAE